MLSYQHGYHAGNFADVVKHLTHTLLIDYLTQKDKPLFYLETHSGRGLYNLLDSQAQKNKEYLTGIAPLWAYKKSLPTSFEHYLSVLKKLNPDLTLKHYPGSPLLAIHGLRNQDRMVFCELHSREFDALTTLHRLGKKVSFQHTDGIEALKALLPPPERRGLIFIDPSYEIKEEYKTIPQAIQKAYKLFPTGVFCLWYPIIDSYYYNKLQQNIKNIGATNAITIEFKLTGEQHNGMTGCGLWIANPPFTLLAQMDLALKTLCAIFNSGQTSYSITP